MDGKNTVKQVSFRLSVTCPFCGQAPGAQCLTGTGRMVSVHRQRQIEISRWWRTREFVMRLKEDDPRFKLQAGDLLLCVNYPYDDKVSVIRRLVDGYDPNCSQYTSDVEFINWYERQ
jgi:hypothetical protein